MSVKLLLSGGLGNQLFQYAALRAHTLRIKTDLKIDLRYFDQYNSADNKKAWLQDFQVESEFICYSSKREAHRTHLRVMRRLITERSKLRYQSATIGFDPKLENVRDGSVVSGLFQSPRHFEKSWEHIEGELDLVKRGIISQEKEYKGIPLIDYVAIHVRRGDYLLTPGFAMVDPINYYVNAMAKAKSAGSKFLIFSDDIGWCSQQVIFKEADYFQDCGKPPYYSLFAMAACRAVIIANSTFSWWGGWFAHRRGAHVIAPKTWILEKQSNDLSLIPYQWSLV